MVTGSDERRQLVDVGVTAGRFVLGGEIAPAVPRQHLDLVQRRQVTGDVAADEPLTPLVEDPESIAVLDAGLACQPGLAGGQEVSRWQVGRIGGESEDLTLEPVDLGVEDHPALAVPVLDDPVVQPLARLEVAPEAATGAARNAGVAEQGDRQRREVPAVAGEAVLRGSGLDEGPVVVVEQAPDHVAHGADLHVVEVVLCDDDVVQLGEERVQHQPAYDLGDPGGIGRQADQRAVGQGVEAGHRTGRRVVRDVVGHRHPSALPPPCAGGVDVRPTGVRGDPGTRSAQPG